MIRNLLFFALVALSCTLITSCKKDTVAPPPTIVSFTPTDGVGPTNNSTVVIITGTGFSATLANNTVKFNGKEAVVTASTATSITTSVPAATTTGVITVTVGGQTATSTTPFRVDTLFIANLFGNAETPPNQSIATGVGRLIFNTDAKTFKIVVTYTGLTPASGHIHKGASGVAGAVVYPFASPLTSPLTYTSDPLTADRQADLLGGLYYVNLHTTAFPGGEIRGQLIVQP